MLQAYPLLTGQAMRYALGAVALLGWIRLRGGRLPVPGRRDWPALVGLVTTGMLGFNACVLYAQRYAEPGFVAAVLGAIGVVEMTRPVDMRVATAAALDHGLWLRPFRNLVYAMPPFICTPDEVATIGAGMVAVARALT